jgi:hypothetical protein
VPCANCAHWNRYCRVRNRGADAADPACVLWEPRP